MGEIRFKNGTSVLLKGLQNKPENNGRQCVVKKYVESSGKYEVEALSGQILKVKHENLEVAPPFALDPVTKIEKPKKIGGASKMQAKPSAEPKSRAEGSTGQKIRAEGSIEQKMQAEASSEQRGRSRSRSPRRCQFVLEQPSADASRVDIGVGRAAPRNSARDVQLSKALSNVLRHTALSMGVQIRKDGFCKVAEIVALSQFQKSDCTQADIQSIVRGNDKARFELREESGDVLVRAVQGHSMKVVEDDSLLQRLSADDPDLPEICVHGTYRRCYEDILKDGLRAGGSRCGNAKRNHVHFAPFEPGDGRVISGMRYNCEVAIYLNLQMAMSEGVPFFRSTNQVILSPGINGIVQAKFFTRVKDLQNAQWLMGEAP